MQVPGVLLHKLNYTIVRRNDANAAFPNVIDVPAIVRISPYTAVLLATIKTVCLILPFWAAGQFSDNFKSDIFSILPDFHIILRSAGK